LDPVTLLTLVLIARSSKDKDALDDLLLPILLIGMLGQTQGQMVVTPGQPPTIAVPLPTLPAPAPPLPPAPAPTLGWSAPPTQTLNSMLPLVLLLLADGGLFSKK
jgi:hypothetical protein